MKFSYASGSRPLDGYTIKRGVGVGGFGEVYYATSDAGKEVALKHIQRNLDVELRGVSQCLNLKHPNLVALFDIRYDDTGDGWVVMEYVTGASLKDVTDEHDQGMPDELVRSWFAGIAAGTAYLHDHGIVHRDLKPGNIFLDEGIVKIGDYGLSKFISVSRRSGQTESVGTFHYMAPEIGKGVYGKEIDVYALGIVLFEMLTGQVPFDGESSQEIIMKHLTADPDLSVLASPYREVVAKALAKDPDNRYSSVVRMAADLEFELGSGANVLPSSAGIQSAGAQSAPSGAQDDEYIVLGPVQEVLQPELVKSPSHGRVPSTPAARHRSPGWGHESGISTSVKIVAAVAVACLLVTNVRWMAPLLPLLGLLYLVFWLLRAAVRSIANSAAAPEPGLPAHSTALAGGNAVAYARNPYRPWQAHAREVLGAKSPRDRITELLGSMLTSGLVAGVLGVVVLVISGDRLAASVHSWGPAFATITLMTIACAWSVLIPSKFWEGSPGEQSTRRFAMLVVGLVMGLLAFGLTQAFLIAPTYWIAGHSAAAARYSELFYTAGGAPQLLAYLGYFAGMFLVLRLWKLADPLRPVRIGLWPTAVCVLWALLLHAFWPMPGGFLLAGTMAITIQLAAPWVTPSQRIEFRRQMLED